MVTERCLTDEHYAIHGDLVFLNYLRILANPHSFVMLNVSIM